MRGRSDDRKLLLRRIRREAGALVRQIRAGAVAYRRERDLPRLLRLDPLAGETIETLDAGWITARLQRALQAERRRARSGHWTYDLNRHIALRQALEAESARHDVPQDEP